MTRMPSFATDRPSVEQYRNIQRQAAELRAEFLRSMFAGLFGAVGRVLRSSGTPRTAEQQA